MNLEKQEVNESLEHQRKILRILRQRLQQRELQEAQYGINVPPEIASEISELTERIRTHETEIARLQTLAAEDQIPLAEAEYRALLSEVWRNGYLEIGGATKLELTRLKLGIIPEHAKSIERKVRILLAKENFYKTPVRYFRPKYDNRESWAGKAALPLGNAIRLDLETTLNLFLKYIEADYIGSGHEDVLKDELFRVHNVWEDQEDRTLFEHFLERLKEAKSHSDYTSDEL